MGSNKRIYNRFEWWSVEDCACEYCVFYQGRSYQCPFIACPVEDVLQEAIRREQSAAI